MKVRKLTIENFRGVRRGEVWFSGNTLLVGGNNVGKSTVCDALELVLGPDRLSRRPPIDEHDFFRGRYRVDPEEESAPQIVIRAILIDLSDELQRRFNGHLRLWDCEASAFIDEEDAGIDRANEPGLDWALPLVFVAQYDPLEDDFVAETYFDHPQDIVDDFEIDSEILDLAQGRERFTRAHKRLCGFIYLRAHRTGTRALSLQRGSLLDTILRLSDDGSAEMWSTTLDKLATLNPAIGDVTQLKAIRDDMRKRLSRFVNVSPGDAATGFFASDLTREHLREVVKLFISAEPERHPVPFNRHGTGAVNLLVFALLTIIADRTASGKEGVIFAMEEPEIGLSPHTQRRVARFVLQEMGQSIITSHSPYVIEQFDAQSVTILARDSEGAFTGTPIGIKSFDTHSFVTNRRQLAEAILARAVLVVEGATEVSIFSEASSVIERSGEWPSYSHIDMSGVSLFNAGSDHLVPRYGPIFKSLGKKSYALVDNPTNPFSDDELEDFKSYDFEIRAVEPGVEDVLVNSIPINLQRSFLQIVQSRDDYPTKCGTYTSIKTDDEVKQLTRKVLKGRKGEWGYAAILVRQCESVSQLPPTIVDMLGRIDSDLAYVVEVDEVAGLETNESEQLEDEE